MYIKDRFKRISHFFLTKIIRNIKLPPATAHVAPPPPHSLISQTYTESSFNVITFIASLL